MDWREVRKHHAKQAQIAHDYKLGELPPIGEDDSPQQFPHVPHVPHEEWEQQEEDAAALAEIEATEDYHAAMQSGIAADGTPIPQAVRKHYFSKRQAEERRHYNTRGEMSGDDHTLTIGEVIARRMELAEQWEEARKKRDEE